MLDECSVCLTKIFCIMLLLFFFKLKEGCIKCAKINLTSRHCERGKFIFSYSEASTIVSSYPQIVPRCRLQIQHHKISTWFHIIRNLIPFRLIPSRMRHCMWKVPEKRPLRNERKIGRFTVRTKCFSLLKSSFATSL